MFLDTYRMSMEHNNQNQLPRHHRRNWNTVPKNVHEEKFYLINIIDIGVRGFQDTIPTCFVSDPRVN